MVTVVGIHFHRRDRIQLMDAIERRHAVALVEVFALRRRTAVEAAEQTGGGCCHVRAAEVISHVGPSKVFVVAALQRADGLELVGKHHARHAEQALPAVMTLPFGRGREGTYPRLFLSEWLEFRLLRQFDVHRHLVARHVLLHPSAVVVAHNLHLCHIVCRDVPRCQVVLAAQQVQALDVELRDGRAHVTDGTALSHIHTRQPLQSVLQRHVALAEERRQVVAQRVAPLPQRGGLHRHLLQRDVLRSEQHVQFSNLLLQRQPFRLLLIADMVKLQRHLPSWCILDFEAIHPLRVTAGERQRLRAAHQFHNHITHGLKTPSNSP